VYRPRDRRSARKKLGIKNDSYVILYVGRISPIDKGDILPFLNIVKDIAHAIRPKPLQVLLGGGSHSGYDVQLSKYIKAAGLSSLVLELHRIPDSELPDFYSAADVFLSLSDNIQECLGIAAIEALACGIPQVVPDWSGYRDTVLDGVTGYRIPTYWTKCDDDICALSPAIPQMWTWSHYNLAQSVAIDLRILRERLISLAQDTTKRLDMGRASVERARACYAWEVIMRRYSHLIDDRITLAKKFPLESAGKRAPFTPSFFASTKHFATSILDDGARLVPTGANVVAPQQSESYAQHFANMEACYPEDPESLLKALSSADTFGEYRELVSKLMLCGPSEANRYIMWLIKYGYLSVAWCPVGPASNGTIII